MTDDGDRFPRSRSGDRAPSGDGWNAGRRRRPSDDRSRSRRSRSTAGAEQSGSSRGTGRSGSGRRSTGVGRTIPRWIPIAGALVVVLLIGGIALSKCGAKSSSDAGACLSDLATHLPEKGGTVYGTDLVQARSAGYQDDGTLEELGSSQQQTGALPDPLTGQVRFGRLVSVDDFTGQTGVKPADIRCALSDGNDSVLSGSFDAAEVRGSALGAADRIAASDNFLVVGSENEKAARKLLDEQKTNLAADDDVSAVVSSLRDQGAYSILLQRNPGKGAIRVAGIGVGGSGDQRQAMVAWRFDTATDAEDGKREVVERANDALTGSASIDATDLKSEGNLVTSTIDVRKAPDLQNLLKTNAALIRRGS